MPLHSLTISLVVAALALLAGALTLNTCRRNLISWI
jgi:hypothetical protein